MWRRTTNDESQEKTIRFLDTTKLKTEALYRSSCPHASVNVTTVLMLLLMGALLLLAIGGCYYTVYFLGEILVNRITFSIWLLCCVRSHYHIFHSLSFSTRLFFALRFLAVSLTLFARSHHRITD